VLQDERIAVALFLVVTTVLDALVDARVSLPGTRGVLSRLGEKLNAGLMFATFSAFFVFGVVQSREYYVVFRPDLVTFTLHSTNQSFGDLPFVVDQFQSTTDLQISLALERLLAFGVLFYRQRPDVFQMVTSPILPADRQKDAPVASIQPTVLDHSSTKEAVMPEVL
jgi:hypothetical protein